MTIKLIKEETMELENNLSKVSNTDITIAVYHNDILERIEGQTDILKFTIKNKLEIKTLSDESLLLTVTIGEYKVPINGQITLEQFDLLYKRPYSVLKSYFENLKKDNQILKTILFPKYQEQTQTVLTAWQERIPDLLEK